MNQDFREALAQRIHKGRSPFIKWDDLSDSQKIGYYQQVDEITTWIKSIGYGIERLGEEVAEGIGKGLKDENPGD